jgi:predicted dinucleotide-binding enzyme
VSGDAFSRSQEEIMRIGIIGAGMIGSTLAKLWADAGHEILISSRHPDKLQSLVEELGPRASSGTPEEAAKFGEAILLTVPLKAVPSLVNDLEPLLRDKIVLDTGNAYAQRDGDIAREASRNSRGTTAWAAALFPRSKWVKAFNSVYFKTLASEAHRSSDPLGIPLASDSPEALEVASQLVRDAGFEPVVLGDLGRGKEFEPGTPVYNTGMSASALRRAFEAVAGGV